jgi:hypothetical protein
MVPIGFFAHEWERTRAEFGYTWRVPRSIARRGIRGLFAMSVQRPADAAMSGVDHLTRRPVRSGG